jgi:hypothetical protein
MQFQNLYFEIGSTHLQENTIQERISFGTSCWQSAVKKSAVYDLSQKKNNWFAGEARGLKTTTEVPISYCQAENAVCLCFAFETQSNRSKLQASFAGNR